MTNNERIEAYFNNQLNDADKEQLLRDIDSDASLKSEFQFQQEVIEGIKAYRKQELIGRLNQIEVASTGQSLLLKTIGVVGIATIITVGTYFLIGNDSEQIGRQEPVNNTEQNISEPVDTQQPAISDDTSNISAIVEGSETEELQTVADEVPPATKGVEKEGPSTSTEDKVTSIVPDIVVPEVMEPDSDISVSIDEDLTAPEAMSSVKLRLSTSTDVEVKLSKKYKFHYQIKNGGLTLYGNFNDSPFEVIELKTNEGINSYLYYKDNFYSLLSDSEEIKPLLVIKNEELIKVLQKRR
jgi:hypothetical protein